MALTQAKPSGTVEAADIIEFRVNALGGGDFGATAMYKVTQSMPGGEVGTIYHTAEWLLTAGEKSTLAGLLPSIKAAIEADLAAEPPEPE